MVPYFADSSFQKVHPKFWDFTKRACTKLMKVLVAIQGRHPFSFGDKSVLPPVMEFCLNKITDPGPELFSFEQFLIQSMVMVKCVLECKEYKRGLTGRVVDESGITQEQIKKNISSAVGGVLTSLLPNERIILLCNVLIRRYCDLCLTSLVCLWTILLGKFLSTFRLLSTERKAPRGIECMTLNKLYCLMP
jgi:hypothetical protein